VSNDYHAVTCPRCLKQLVIRLHHDEVIDTPCQCKRVVCTVEWADRIIDDKPVYAPALIQKGTEPL